MADEPTNPVTPLEGRTTLDDKMAFEPERLSYQSADHVAMQIAKAVGHSHEPGGPPVIITGGELLTDLANLTSVEVLLRLCIARYRNVETFAEGLQPSKEDAKEAAQESPALLLPGIPTVAASIQSAVGLIGLLREDVQYHGAQTTVDPLAFRFAVASRLKASGIPVRVHDMAILTAPDVKESALLRLLDEVEQERAMAWTVAAPYVMSLIEVQMELDEAARIAENTAAVQDAAKRLSRLRQRISPISDALEGADAQFAALRTHLEKIDESTGLMTLGKLLRAERAKAEGPRYLHVGVVSGGGHLRVSRNLFRMLFLGDGVSALGGVVVRWALLASDGSFIDGGILDARSAADFPSRCRRWLLGGTESEARPQADRALPIPASSQSVGGPDRKELRNGQR